MKSCIAASVFCAAWMYLTVSTGDQNGDGAKRGPEHKVLESLAGTYQAKVKLFVDPKAPPVESTGIMTRVMILDGNFLQETFKGTFFGKDFTGIGMYGYDAIKKKYLSVWFDNMSTSTTMMHGTFDPEKKAFTFIGEDIGPSGQKAKSRDVLKIINADEQIFEMYRRPEGSAAEIKVMEIVYMRKG
jgi:hypothetical protein